MEKKELNIELSGCGVFCDNEKCTWESPLVDRKQYIDWVNKPCPLCGENILTEQDYQQSKQMEVIIDFLNTLTPEEFTAIGGGESIESLQNNPVFANTKGLDTLKMEGNAVVTIEVHNGVKITEIKNVED